jgi:dimeric dUTPase (all-alpha-NTP-PPase superfamily)
MTEVKDPFLSNEDYELMLEDKLHALFAWQQELIDIVVPEGMDQKHVAKLMVGCVLGEAAEANAHFLNETKPWKPSEPNWKAVDEEMIDVLHFLLEYFIMRGYSPYSVITVYRHKNLTNQERVRSKLSLDGGTH